MRYTRIFLIIFCIAIPMVGMAAQGIHLRFEDFPKDWKVIRTYTATSAELVTLGNKFTVPLLGVTNVVFQVGVDTIQINTMSCRNNRDAATLYKNMVNLVGHTNAVLEKDNGVVEMITTNPALTQWVVHAIQPPIVHLPDKENTS